MRLIMAINESVYGSANNWIDTYFYDKFYHNKKANFGDNTTRLLDGVAKGKLSYTEPIDKSLSYCGLGTESALSHLKVVDVTNGATRIVDTIDRFTTNFGFFEIAQNTGIDGNYAASQLNEMKIYRAWQEITDDSDVYWSINKNKILCPYTLIHPKSVVFVINVRAYNSNDAYDDFTLDEYRTAHTNYPRISQVTITPYMNNPNAFSENQPTRTTTGGGGGSTLNNYKKGFIIGLLDEYKLENKNFDMYSYYLSDERLVMGNVTAYKVRNRNTAVSMAYVPDNAATHFVHDLSDDYIRCYIEYYDGVIEDILKTVACFGLYFTDKLSVAQSGTFTNNDMYIGLLDENGIGHGLYLRGVDTANAPQNNYTDMSQSGYDYTKKVDKTDYQNNTTFYGNLSSRAFTKMYVLTDAEVSSLANELYTAVSQAPAGEEIERYNQSVFLTQNPIDCIISLKKFPCELPFSTSTAIKLGSYTCTTTGSPLLYTTGVYQFTFSNALKNSLYPVNDKSFLDYEPYTKAELSIPFCGTVEIPCSYLYDYDDLTAYLIIDYITGACTAYITARGIAIDSTSGNAAITMPVNGLQSATLDSQIHAAAVKDTQASNGFALSLAGGAAAIIASLFTGGAAAPLLAITGAAVGIGGAALNAQTTHESIDYELQHMQTPLKQISAASGAISQSYDMRCKLRITRPKLDSSYNAAVYANTVGYACCINTTVNDLTGLTVGTVNLDGIAATETEKQMISQAFAQGVIL